MQDLRGVRMNEGPTNLRHCKNFDPVMDWLKNRVYPFLTYT